MTDPIMEGISDKVTLGGQLRELQRWPYATAAIVVAAIGVYAYLAVEIRGTSHSMLELSAIVDYGTSGSAIAAGQWWRMVTADWLHINAMHLVGNMAALGVIGRSVERMVGWRGFAIAYVLSGLGGSLASGLAQPYTMSIGASGAVFGVFGCLVGYTVRYPGTFPSQGLRSLMWAGLAYLGYMVAFGTGPGVDWVAHAGGFVAGAICGAVLTAPIEPSAVPTRWKRDVRLAIGGAVVVAGTVLAMSGRLPTVAQVAAGTLDRDAWAAQQTRAAVEANPRDLAAHIHGVAAPAVREARDYLASFDRLPAHQRRALDTLDTYLVARERAWIVLASGLAAGDYDEIETARALHAAADLRLERLHDALDRVVEEPLADPVAIAPMVASAIDAIVTD